MALMIKAQTNGFDSRWFDYEGDVSFKICGIGKGEYRIGIERARRIIERKESRLDLHDLTVSAQDRAEQDIQAELIGRYLIQDWKGNIQNESGETVAYSPEQAAALLRSIPSLVVWVLSKAIEVEADIAEEHEEIVGKSLDDSSGNKSGEDSLKSDD